MALVLRESRGVVCSQWYATVWSFRAVYVFRVVRSKGLQMTDALNCIQTILDRDRNIFNFKRVIVR